MANKLMQLANPMNGNGINFLIDFVRLLPENMLLLTQTIELGLKLDERDKCYNLFKYFFINKRYKKFKATHWKR